MAKSCHMPPRDERKTLELHGLLVHEEHIRLNDTCCIKFDQSGIFLYYPPGNFSPEIPTGIFLKDDVSGPFTAIRESDTTFVFVSFDDAKTNLDLVKIWSDYPLGEDKCS